MADTEKRIAVLIDADNAPASKIDVILNEVATFGVANVRRAYGNWKSPSLKPWEDNLHEHAIQPVQQFAYSKGKNASDIAMVIDALDLLHSGVMDGCAIVSSDADFTPLVMRLRASGISVHGFGERKTPEPFVNACSTFTYVDALRPPTASARRDHARRPATLRGDARLVQMLRAAVAAAADERGRLGAPVAGAQPDRQPGVVRPAQLRLREVLGPRRGHRAVRDQAGQPHDPRAAPAQPPRHRPTGEEGRRQAREEGSPAPRSRSIRRRERGRGPRSRRRGGSRRG